MPPATPPPTTRSLGTRSTARLPAVVVCLLAGLPGCGSLLDVASSPIDDAVDKHYKVGLAYQDDESFYRQVAHEVVVTTEEERDERLEEAPATLQADERATRLVSLEQVIRIALANASIVRDDAQFLSASNSLLANPNYVPSAFDPDIQGSGGPFGIGGIEQAKAQFDPYFVSGASAGQNNLVQNNQFISGGLVPGTVLEDESGLFTSRLEKRTEYGSFLSLNHDLNYTNNNQPNRFFPSAYSGLVRAELRQPLLAGFGKEFTQIAGPIARTPSAVQPVDRGLVVSRINERISLIDFESNLQNLVRSVHFTYWDLALAQKVQEDQTAARDAAEQLWKRVRARLDAGLGQVDRADEAQARERYLQWKATADSARSDVLEAEARLRRLLGMPAGGGESLRAVDTPSTADVELDWRRCLAEALTKRIELRRQKSLVKSLALQQQASKNLQRPRLDLVGGYQLNGFGDDLLSNDAATDFGNPYASLLRADQAGWDFGLQLSMPFGNRSAKSLTQNLELRLTKARAALAAQEIEIGHELAHSFRELDRWKAAAEAREYRLAAAEDLVIALAADYEAGRGDLDALLRARTNLLQAQVELAQARVRYRKAIVELHARKGTVLDNSAIRLSEGTWDVRGLAEALQLNWQRTKTFDDIAPLHEDGEAPDFVAFAGDDSTVPSAAEPSGGKALEKAADGAVEPAEFESPIPTDAELVRPRLP